MSQACFNTLECYCDSTAMELIIRDWGTKKGHLAFEKIIATPEPLATLPVSALDETAWKLKYGADLESSIKQESLSCRSLKWKTVADFHEAANRLEHNRITYGTYSVDEWRSWNWGTPYPPYNSRRFQIAEPSASKPHVWEFDTYRFPPFPVIRKLSERLPHIPLHLFAYSCAMEAWCCSSFIAGYKVKKRHLPVPTPMKSWVTGSSNAETK